MNDERRFLVYMHRLKQDGRVYIGQTCSSLKERSGSNGHRYKYCTKFWNAIQKYGWDSFEHIVIQEHLTLEEANALEEKLIQEYNSIENGFNLVAGGRNHLWPKEYKIQMSERNKGEKNTNFGKPRSEETKRKIGMANAISLLGHHPSEETRKKMSKSHQKNIPILCIETGVIYSCPSEAAVGIGKKPNNGGAITEVCKGKRKSAYGYTWCYLDKDMKGK